MKRSLVPAAAIVAVMAVVMAGCSTSTSQEVDKAAGESEPASVNLGALTQGQQNSVGNASAGFSTPISPDCVTWAASWSPHSVDSSKYEFYCGEVADNGLIGFSTTYPGNPDGLGYWGPLRMGMTGFQKNPAPGNTMATFPDYLEGATSFQYGSEKVTGIFTLSAASTSNVPTTLAGRSLQVGIDGDCGAVDEYFKCVRQYNDGAEDTNWVFIGNGADRLLSSQTYQVRNFPTVFEFRSMGDLSWEVQDETLSGFMRDPNGERGKGGNIVPAMHQPLGSSFDVNASVLRAGYRSTKGSSINLKLFNAATGASVLVKVDIPANTDSLTQANFPGDACKVNRQPTGQTTMGCKVIVTQGAVQTVSFVLTYGGIVVGAVAKGKKSDNPPANDETPTAGSAPAVNPFCQATKQKPKHQLCPQLYNKSIFDLTNLQAPEALNTAQATVSIQATTQPVHTNVAVLPWFPLVWSPDPDGTGSQGQGPFSTSAVQSAKSGSKTNMGVGMKLNNPIGGSQIASSSRPMTAATWAWSGASYDYAGDSFCRTTNYFSCDLTAKGQQYSGGKNWWGPQQGVTANPVRIRLHNDTKNNYLFVKNAAVTGNFLSSYALSSPSLVSDPVLSSDETATYGGWASMVNDPTAPLSSFSTTLIALPPDSGKVASTGSLVNLNIVFSWKDGKRVIDSSNCTAVSPSTTIPVCAIGTVKSGFQMTDAGFTTIYASIK